MSWRFLPNIITIIRLILLIPLTSCLLNENYTCSLIIFFVAGLSDALDGFLAKRFNWVSRLGSILDPIADKALLVVTMGILTLNSKISGLLFISAALRDVCIILGAYIYYKKIGPYSMQPSLISKLNTFLQILLVTLILVSLSYYQIDSIWIDSLVGLVYFTIVTSTIHYGFVWGKKFTHAKRTNVT